MGEALEKGSRMQLWERTGPRSTPGSVARGTEMGCLASCLLTHGRRLETPNSTIYQTSCYFNRIISLRCKPSWYPLLEGKTLDQRR